MRIRINFHYTLIVSSLASFLFVIFEAMYENSPEYFKKFQKHFKYNICETEPKLENTIENYAYGYHSSATVIEGCTFGFNHYHVCMNLVRRMIIYSILFMYLR